MWVTRERGKMVEALTMLNLFTLLANMMTAVLFKTMSCYACIRIWEQEHLSKWEYRSWSRNLISLSRSFFFICTSFVMENNKKNASFFPGR